MRSSETGTVQFITRLGVCIAVFGSVAGLAMVGTQAAFAIYNREELRESDDSIRKSVAGPDLFTSIEQRIARHEAMIKRLQSPLAKKEEERNLAALYEELGHRSYGFSQLARAEEAYQKSTALDPDNPQYVSDLAKLYAAAAVKQAERRQRVSLLRNSSRLWQNVATTTRDPNQRARYRNSAASALVGLASEFSKVGMANEALQELRTARDFADDGSPLELQIDQLMHTAGN